MTLVLAVSANTAAYAADAMKPARRISSKAQAEDMRVDAERDARRTEAGDPAVEQLIPPALIGLDLLGPEQHPYQQHATLAQAQAAYRDLDD